MTKINKHLLSKIKFLFATSISELAQLSVKRVDDGNTVEQEATIEADKLSFHDGPLGEQSLTLCLGSLHYHRVHLKRIHPVDSRLMI